MDMYIIAYDISSNKKRGKIFDILKGYGISMQYSLFVIKAKEATIARLSSEIKKMLKEGDRFAVYKVNKYDNSYAYGFPREEVKFEI